MVSDAPGFTFRIVRFVSFAHIVKLICIVNSDLTQIVCAMRLSFTHLHAIRHPFDFIKLEQMLRTRLRIRIARDTNFCA